ncbi:MAG TPA: hypothetical protein PKV12_01065 [Candidatus Syntrophosphaera sp.]|nr:hypothetical protein [Candidatus Syntrophosphaera sp.]
MSEIEHKLTNNPASPSQLKNSIADNRAKYLHSIILKLSIIINCIWRYFTFLLLYDI